MKSHVQRIVDQTSVVAAGLGIVLSPVPLADEALILPVLGTMVVRIGRLHGLGLKEIPWAAIAKTALGGIVARATVTLGVSYIPFVAAGANALSAATLTEAFGAYADRACADPSKAHAETIDELKVDIRELSDRWRRLFTAAGRQAAREARAADPGSDADAPPAARAAASRAAGADVRHSSDLNFNGGTSMSASNMDPTDPTKNIPAACPSGVGPAPVVEEVRSDIERTLRTRHYGHGKVLFAVEDGVKSVGAKAWDRFKNRPYAGIAVASAVGFGVASVTGVGELAIAVMCGYAAYEVLRRGRPVGETVEEMVRDVGKMG